MTLSLSYEREGDDHHIVRFNSEAIPDIKIDYTGIPLEERGGTSVQLLGASCLYCFAATFGSAMKARKADILSLKGQIELTKGKDEVRRTKVTEIEITLDVEIDDKDEATFEKCKKIMERGCLITYTLEESIEIDYNIRRV